MLKKYRFIIPDFLRPSLAAPRWMKACIREGRILGGPFGGLRYSDQAVGSVLAAKILGVYELELAPFLESFKSISFTQIVDVGAAEGYYAIGAARAWPAAQVIAFESEVEGRKTLAVNACLNAVDKRVDVRGHCQTVDLAGAMNLVGPTLLIMDVEGAEEQLIDLEAVPQIRGAHLIIELHDCFFPGIRERIVSRLTASHKLTEVYARERRKNDFVCLPFWVRSYLQAYLPQFADERRPGPMSWLIGVPIVRDSGIG